MIGSCCEVAMKEVEGTGVSEKFIRFETVETADGLVYTYKCKDPDCGEVWKYEVQTQPEDDKRWYQEDQSRFN